MVYSFAMQVRDIMHSATKISSNIGISEAARIMEQKLIGSVLVEENGKIIGIMTERDILRKVVARSKNPDELKARDIMSSPLITIDADASIEEASSLMDEKRIRRLVVTENGKIVGKITANEISRNLRLILAKEKSIFYREDVY